MLLEAVLSDDVQQFIADHLKSDTNKLLLGKKLFQNTGNREIVQQIIGKNKALKKLPTWYKTAQILYPVSLSIEQTSSETTAKYKASLIDKNTHLADLTGGFGVDSFYFAQECKQVDYCEVNHELFTITAHNFKVLNVENIRLHQTDGILWLKNTAQKLDYIYLDPSRRTQGIKVFKLKDCEPDVVSNFDLLTEKANHLLIKTAPLLDISAGLAELKNVTAIHIISINNEVKELLWVIAQKPTSNPDIFCALINNEIPQVIHFNLEEEVKITLKSHFSSPQKYLYEPDAAILKAGMFKSTAIKFGVKKLHKNSHLYTSEEIVKDFPGKVFEIDNIKTFGDFSKQKNIEPASIVSRNFRLKADEIRKKYKIAENGIKFLFFTTLENESSVVISAIKIKA